MKQEYPTKEEVLNLKAFWWNRPLVMKLCDAYLTLLEEVERKDKLIKRQDGFIMDKSAIAAERSTQISQLEVEVKQLKADNEALMEDYKEANVLLNGYDKLLTKLRDRRDKDQEEIRKLHADNEALRARLGNNILEA